MPAGNESTHFISKPSHDRDECSMVLLKSSKEFDAIALMHVYVTQANFTTKPRFEIKNKRSFTEMNSQGSRVEKNTHAQKVQMQKILFTNEACW